MQDIVGHVQYISEQVELLGENLERETLRLIVFGQEVDDRDVAFLPIAVAASDALLDTLRIPR